MVKVNSCKKIDNRFYQNFCKESLSFIDSFHFSEFCNKKCGGYRVNMMIKNWLQQYFHKFSPNVRSGAKFRHSRSSAVIISQRRRPAPSCPICLNHRLRADGIGSQNWAKHHFGRVPKNQNSENHFFYVGNKGRHPEEMLRFFWILFKWRGGAYLIFVIFFTRAKFLENKIYTEKTR